MPPSPQTSRNTEARSKKLLRGFVTTTRKVRKRDTSHAESIARTVDLPYVLQNGSMRFMRRRHEADYCIVVSTNNVRVDWDGGDFKHHPGMAIYRVGVATRHPFLAALEPRVGDRTLDTTLGLARDALVVADRTDNLVDGVEQNRIIGTFTALGLDDLLKIRRFRPVVPRIRVQLGNGYKVLSAQSLGRYDHILIDPMFPSPVSGSSDMEFLHRMVDPVPFRNEIIRRACAVAKKRVVLRWPGWKPLPDLPFTRVIPGARSSFYFLVMDLQAWDTRRHFRRR